MSGVWGSVITAAVLALVVALAVRSLWKTHKAGKTCNGNCAGCRGCH